MRVLRFEVRVEVELPMRAEGSLTHFMPIANEVLPPAVAVQCWRLETPLMRGDAPANCNDGKYQTAGMISPSSPALSAGYEHYRSNHDMPYLA